MTASDEVARELASLVKEQPCHARLRDLADAIAGLNETPPRDEQARLWSTVSLYDAFLGADDEVGADGEVESPQGRFWHGMEMASQVLVFVPIVLTWLGLGLATIAYHDGLKDPKLAGVSFFQGWQTGFDGRLPAFVTFGWLAWYTVMIVAVLIVVVILNARHDKYVSGPLRSEFRRRLASALTGADLALAPFRLGLPDQMAREIEAAVGALSRTVSEIKAAGRVARQVQVKAADALDALVSVFGPLTCAASSVENAASALSGIPVQLGAEMAQLGAALSVEIGELKSGLAADIGLLTTEVGALGGQLGTQVGRLGTHLGTMATATSGVAAAQRDLTDASARASQQIADALAAGAGQVRESVAEVAGSLAVYARQAEVAADILGQAQQGIQALPASVSKVDAGVTGLRGEITALNAGLGKLGGQLPSVTASAEQLQRLADLSDRLAGLAALGDQVSALTTAVTALTADRGNSRPADQAAADLQTAVTGLNAAAAELRAAAATATDMATVAAGWRGSASDGQFQSGPRRRFFGRS